jgi:hypothetical protein
MPAMSGDRQRLADQMDESRAEQSMSWEQVAQRGGISIALLRRIRSGGRITKDSEIAIERGLNWVRGSVANILRGGPYTYGFVEPTSKRKRAPLDPLTSSPEEIAEFLEEVRQAQGEEAFFELFQATLKVNMQARDDRERAGVGRTTSDDHPKRH